MAVMNDQERELQYPFGETIPPLGTSVEVAPGIRWLRMSLPFALNHINLWLLRDEEPAEDDDRPARQGWTLVDCGIASDDTRAAWEQIFASDLEGLPVLRVIVTHMHPDHMGLAHWLTERWGVRLWISATDYTTARLAISSTAGFGGPKSADFMASHGLVDEEAKAQIAKRSTYYSNLVPSVPDTYRRLHDGDAIAIGSGAERADWVLQVGHGHAPEHMALYCERRNILISGDMVLPRISTNVSVIDTEPEADPLTRYLDSIARMRSMPADTLVLPSHGLPFKGLHTRIDQLTRHHAERFADVLKACAESPQSAADLLMLLFKRKLDVHQTTFAMGESIAHLNALWLAGKLRRKLVDGVYRFTTR